jgi:3'(2'), 5'-bisphosphate nucleotidase
LKVANYSTQAVINTILSHAFPDDPIIGKEDAADLRSPAMDAANIDEASALLHVRVVELADSVLAQPPYTLLLFARRREWRR